MSNAKLVAALLVGAAAGAAIAVFLNSEKGKEVLEDLKGVADKYEEKIKESINKGKEFVQDLAGDTQT